ncbi:unnamed protein product [Spirodela intermedia]|uniref:ENTH domain-containing protein n=1 Tax=Spirodela intermedia TaxID=51605 RepID=A0A7I8KWC8_SPIIN|nr:unnamed protein product [Spirodela intermedia]
MSTTPRKWWRLAAATVKDKRSLCLARLRPPPTRQQRSGGGGSGAARLRHHPELEAAVIKATSHDETRMDYKSAGKVFAWARTSPSVFLRPLMWALSRRVRKTRSWAVALKSLMLAHGVLLCCRPTAAAAGRLPFDLSSFHDRSSWGLSAFVRAYFNFLDQRSIFLTDAHREKGMRRVEKTQDLMELLMQVRPYGDEGAGARLLLEAMDCVVVEIFEVYSAVCSGIAGGLVGIFGACSAPPSLQQRKAVEGAMGIRVLRRAAEQSSQLAAYFELCRRMGVLNAAELPPVERIPEEDIEDLEMLLWFEASRGETGGGIAEGMEEDGRRKRLGTVVTENWVVFDDEPAPSGAAPCSCWAEPLLLGPPQNGL